MLKTDSFVLRKKHAYMKIFIELDSGSRYIIFSNCVNIY